MPDVHKLLHLAKSRTGMTLAEYLTQLSTVSIPEATAQLLYWLLDIPSNELQVSTVTRSLVWGRSEHKVSDSSAATIETLRKGILLPFLQEVLPSPELSGEAILHAEDIWTSIVGPKLLNDFNVKTSVADEACFADANLSPGNASGVDDRKVPPLLKVAPLVTEESPPPSRMSQGRAVHAKKRLVHARMAPYITQPLPSSRPSEKSWKISVHRLNPAGEGYPAMAPLSYQETLRFQNNNSRRSTSYYSPTADPKLPLEWRSPFLIAKRPYSLEASQLSHRHSSLHRFAKKREMQMADFDTSKLW